MPFIREPRLHIPVAVKGMKGKRGFVDPAIPDTRLTLVASQSSVSHGIRSTQVPNCLKFVDRGVGKGAIAASATRAAHQNATDCILPSLRRERRAA